MNIFVGSTNPVKLAAVTSAAQGQWSEVVVEGMAVPSGVSEQPRSDEETRRGARNRALAALIQGETKSPQKNGTTLLGLGLEGGIFLFDGELWSIVWVAVIDGHHQYYESSGACFKLPARIAEPLAAGGEMGPVVSQLFAGVDIKRQQGTIGVITRNFVDRAEEYASIAKLALGLWYGREWEQTIKTANI